MRKDSESIHNSMIKRMLRITCFFAVIFTLLFCVTWQNIDMYLLNRKITELTIKRNELEKSIYLKRMELSTLQSRQRIKRIAEEQLDMEPVTYTDVKVIIY